jgi:hypothetical protein
VGSVSADQAVDEEAKTMSKEEATNNAPEHVAGPRYQVRLQGFISDETIGLGDVIKRTTYAMGVKPGVYLVEVVD